MPAEAFDRALRGFSRRVPFRRFTVELVSGTRFTTEHAEALVFRGARQCTSRRTEISPSLIMKVSVGCQM
jgi:hypothetical protein